MPPLKACAPRGPAYPEVTRAICRVPSTPFSQTPRYTLPVHLCRFRVRSICWRCFLERRTPPGQSSKPEQRLPFVTSSRPGNINPVPIGYGCRPRLRGRLTLSGLALLRNPWTFGGSVSHTPFRYSCQHSHFRYLQAWSPTPFTGLRNAPLPLRGQMTGIRYQRKACPPARANPAASWRSHDIPHAIAAMSAPRYIQDPDSIGSIPASRPRTPSRSAKTA